MIDCGVPDCKVCEIQSLKTELAAWKEQETPGIAACMRLNAKLREERDRLRSALEAAEWQHRAGQLRCPGCLGSRSDGHKLNCPTGIALGRPECLERAS